MGDDNMQVELARRYIERTGVSVFLTGKAGTGKTTFLREVAANCPKRHVVVAPTGVAAVNAGGVTIHSFFQLPFDPYLPDVKELLTEYQTGNHKQMGRHKVEIMRTLELLIVDEVSMVRADLMDAMDMTLRRVRRSGRPFGGVQLLMIGDVHQLAPVVTERERPYMERVYPSPYFFNSKALQQVQYVTIELTHVYRQQDREFVELLNRVRENNIDPATLAALNSRVVFGTENGERRTENSQTPSLPGSQTYRLTDSQPSQPPITLTTHNRQADAINERHLQALTGERRTLEARVSRGWPDAVQPVERVMDVRVGERVMFAKNDSSAEHRYYNGKLGTVAGFQEPQDDDGEAECAVLVDCDDGGRVAVGREVWETYKYAIDPKDNQIKQSVEGTFCQYPLRPAWAVTIHKAQGLTFDRVRINAAEAFAFGQVYVALSRCRSLEGLTLTTPLTAGVAFGDADVERFVGSRPTLEQTAASVGDAERQYYYAQLADLFGADALLADMERLVAAYARLRPIYPQQVAAMTALGQGVADLASVGERFRGQLMRLPAEAHADRIAKGAAYYAERLSAIGAALGALLDVEVDNKENEARIKDAAANVRERVGVKLACVQCVQERGFDVAAIQGARAAYLTGAGDGHRGDGRKAKAEGGKAQRRKAEGTRPKAAGAKDGLVARLAAWRREKAEQTGVSAYMVMQQRTLMAIAEARPRTREELLAVPGIGRIKADLYGEEILGVVGNFFSDGAQ